MKRQGLLLANPIASDLGVMRPSILPNLISALQRNADRGASDLAIFEAAPIYVFPTQPDGQLTVATGARASHPGADTGKANRRRRNVFSVKADALAALEAAGVNTASLQTMDGRSILVSPRPVRYAPYGAEKYSSGVW